MARSTIYPKANTSAQWWGGNSTMGGISKLLLHTTETGVWPGYGGGGSAPTLTYHPVEHQWRQHMPLNESARALRDPSGTVVRENRDDLVQVEIICTCDWDFARRHNYPHVTQLDARALDDLADFARFLHDEWGLPLRKAPVWLPYPRSYGNSAARMSSREYDRFRGICGHQHASGNTHGDPGDIDIDAILARATRRPTQDTAPPNQGEDDLMATEEQRQELIDQLLDEPLNVHDPDGNVVTRNVTLRELFSALGHLANREVPGYFDRAQKSKAPK